MTKWGSRGILVRKIQIWFIGIKNDDFLLKKNSDLIFNHEKEWVLKKEFQFDI